MKKPIFSSRIRCNPFLNAFADAESIIHWSKPFHRSTTRSAKKCRLKSSQHLFFSSLAVCPLVHVAVCRTKKSLNGVVDIPCTSWTLLASQLHFFSLHSRVHNLRRSSLFSHGSFFNLRTILVNLCCTSSNSLLSLTYDGDQADTQYSRCGRTRLLYNFTSRSAFL